MTLEEFSNGTGELWDMRAGLLRGRATHVQHAYPVRLEQCARRLPHYEEPLRHAAECLRSAERALAEAESTLAIVLADVDAAAVRAARQGEVDGTV